MKKSIILTLLLTAFYFSTSYAQIGVRLGIKGGVNFSSLNSDFEDFDLENRTGYHVGAFGTFKFTKLAIQPELLYSTQGSNSSDVPVFDDFGNLIGTGDLENNFNYVSIPILAKFYIIGGLHIYAGPTFSFLTSADAKSSFGGFETEEDVKDNLTSSDISLSFGAGIDLPLRLTADIRYNLGVSDINDDPSADIELRNRVLQISIGYRLINKG
jgi:hypothetical protein